MFKEDPLVTLDRQHRERQAVLEATGASEGQKTLETAKHLGKSLVASVLADPLSGLMGKRVFSQGEKAIVDPGANAGVWQGPIFHKDLHYAFDPVKLDQVIGARRLKRWIELRRAAFVDGNVPPGLDPPRGVLLLGVQGCGKSMLAKAIAAGFAVPLLRLDFGALYNKYHGETEKNLRDALASAEQLAPCVLWIDEIEKGLASSGGEDGGVSRRVLGTFLTWMSERRQQVFLVATANQVQDLPAELLRKGRFDEIFFVDLPTPEARADLFAVHLRRRGADPDKFDLPALAGASDGFSGAEIEQAVVAALYTAHAANHPINDFHLRAELKNTRPLSVLMAEQVTALREWAAARTVSAD